MKGAKPPTPEPAPRVVLPAPVSPYAPNSDFQVAVWHAASDRSLTIDSVQALQPGRTKRQAVKGPSPASQLETVARSSSQDTVRRCTASQPA